MLKKMFTKKLCLIVAIAFSVTLMSFVPNEEQNLEIKQELEYVDKEVAKSVIYLLDSNNYLGRTMVVISDKEVEAKAKELLEILIKDGKGESKIPNGFKAIISSETKIKSLTFNEGLIKVDFSSELLDTNKETEEKIVEAIVYTLTSIESVDKVIIYVDGEILTKLPKTGINLPSTLEYKAKAKCRRQLQKYVFLFQFSALFGTLQYHGSLTLSIIFDDLPQFLLDLCSQQHLIRYKYAGGKPPLLFRQMINLAVFYQKIIIFCRINIVLTNIEICIPAFQFCQIFLDSGTGITG